MEQRGCSCNAPRPRVEGAPARLPGPLFLCKKLAMAVAQSERVPNCEDPHPAEPSSSDKYVRTLIKVRVGLTLFVASPRWSFESTL